MKPILHIAKPIQFPLPAGTKNPVTFKKALKMLIGGQHLDDREAILRHFLKAQGVANPGEAVGHFRKCGVPLRTLMDWNDLLPRWRKYNQAEKNREQALKRWSKAKRRARPPVKRLQAALKEGGHLT